MLGLCGGICCQGVDNGEMCVCQRACELVLGPNSAQLDGDGDMIMPVGQHVPYASLHLMMIVSQHMALVCCLTGLPA
jgi:hypothetical protein